MLFNKLVDGAEEGEGEMKALLPQPPYLYITCVWESFLNEGFDD